MIRVTYSRVSNSRRYFSGSLLILRSALAFLGFTGSLLAFPSVTQLLNRYHVLKPQNRPFLFEIALAKTTDAREPWLQPCHCLSCVSAVWKQVSQRGEIKVPLSTGILSDKDVGVDLGDIIVEAKPAGTFDKESRIFDSPGLASLDAAPVEVVYRKDLSSAPLKEMAILAQWHTLIG
jgi:hypothetical protein